MASLRGKQRNVLPSVYKKTSSQEDDWVAYSWPSPTTTIKFLATCFKFDLDAWKSIVPPSTAWGSNEKSALIPLEWALQRVVKMKSVHGYFYPLLVLPFVYKKTSSQEDDWVAYSWPSPTTTIKFLATCFKFDLDAWKSIVPPSTAWGSNEKSAPTPLEWALQRVDRMKSVYGYFYPLLVELAEVALSAPITNA